MATYSVMHKAAPKSFNAIHKASQWELAKETNYWREQMGWEAKVKRLPRPIQDQVDITVVLHRKNSRPIDTASCFVAYKAAQDSLVDVGVLKQDDPKYVRRVTFEPATISGFDALELILNTVEEESKDETVNVIS